MEPLTPPSARKPKHHHAARFTACFRPSAAENGGEGTAAAAAAEAERPGTVSLIRSSSTWLCSKAHDLHQHHHRRRRSADFRYDALSYALNFDAGASPEPVLFSARLPASPPPAFEIKGRERS